MRRANRQKKAILKTDINLKVARYTQQIYSKVLISNTN